MNALLLAVILAQTAQPQIPQAYTPFYLPEAGRQAYCVTLKGGGDLYHGYLIGEDETSSGKPLQIEVYFRETAGRQLQKLVRDFNGQLRGQLEAIGRDKYESAVPESERAQRDVVERYLKQEGLVQIQTANGAVWVQQREVDLIDKANQMAKANTPPDENPFRQLLSDEQSVEPGLENASVSGTGDAPGFLSLWGPQIIVLAVAIVLLAAIGYITFLRG